MINRLPNKYRDAALAHDGRRKAPTLDEPAQRSSMASRLWSAATRSVGSYPVACLGAAFATGLLLGKLVKR
jgi:hypothetical protein